jgi:hypothetical protein
MGWWLLGQRGVCWEVELAAMLVVEGKIVEGVFDGMVVVVVVVVEGDSAVEMVEENIAQEEQVEGNIPPAETVEVNIVAVESFVAGHTLVAKDTRSQ